MLLRPCSNSSLNLLRCGDSPTYTPRSALIIRAVTSLILKTLLLKMHIRMQWKYFWGLSSHFGFTVNLIWIGTSPFSYLQCCSAAPLPGLAISLCQSTWGDYLMKQICIRVGPCLRRWRSYLSVTPGKMKNIQKWIPNTRMTWKMTFPNTVFLRYSARSTTMVPNWMRTITKNGPGTWSSDSEEVMSAAAECFWKETTGSGPSGISQPSITLGCVVAFTPNLPQRPRSQRQWWQSRQCRPGTWAHTHRSRRCSRGGWGCRRTVWWAHIFAESCKTDTPTHLLRRGQDGRNDRYCQPVPSIPILCLLPVCVPDAWGNLCIFLETGCVTLDKPIPCHGPQFPLSRMRVYF